MKKLITIITLVVLGNMPGPVNLGHMPGPVNLGRMPVLRTCTYAGVTYLSAVPCPTP